MEFLSDLIEAIVGNTRVFLTESYDDPPFPTVYVWVRIATLLVILAAVALKMAAMAYHTKFWDSLGRAMRAENAVYFLLWAWFLVSPMVPHLRHPLILFVLEVMLIWVTINVIRALPRVPLLRLAEHLRIVKMFINREKRILDREKEMDRREKRFDHDQL